MKKFCFWVSILFGLSLNAQIPNYVPSKGLIAWWPFTGNAKDSSGNENHGTVNGAVLTTDRFGNLNSAMQFFQQQYVEVPNLYQNNINEYTISAWFKRPISSSGNDGAIVSGSSLRMSPAGLRFNIGSINRLQWGIEGNTVNGVLQNAPGDNTNYCDSVWHFCVATFSSSNGLISSSAFKIFVDGSLIKTITYHDNWPTWDTTAYAPINNGSRNTIIGNCGGSANYNNVFRGALDDIGIWNRALTQCEISQLYNSKKNSLYSGSQIVVQKCDIDSLILQGKSGYENYTWNNGHSGVNNTVYQTGQYLLTMTDSNGCEATDTFQVSLISSIVKPMDTTICPNNLVELSTMGNAETSPCSKPAGTLANGLIGWWPFCGNANDLSTNNNHGTVKNGAQLTIDRFGNANSAYSFDGNNDHIEVNHNSTFNVNELTVSCWVSKDTQAIYLPGPVSKCEASTNKGWYIASISNRLDSISFQGGHSSGKYWGATSLPLINNNWVHVVGTFAPNLQQIFINGILVGKGTNSGSLYNASESLLIGKKNGDGYWSGLIDDIGLWNRALTPQEIWELYTMNDPQNLSVEWSTGDTSQSITVQPSVETSYWVKTTDGIGTCYDSCTIHVSQPMANLMGDSVSCNGYSDGSAMANPSGGINPYSYKWSTGDTINHIQNLQPGMYSVVILDSIGCADTQSIQIGEPAPIIVEINEPLRTLKDLPISITSSISPIGSYQYAWSPSSLFGSQSNLESPSIQAKSGSQIILKVVDKNGCEGSDTATLEVLQGAGVIFPNSFSPNDDGMNDFFKPHPYFDLLDLKIYNAWGQCFYQSNGAKGGWDGTFAGEKVPAGAYVYQMQVQLTGTNQIINQSGSVTLVR